jgi:erythromycin esterase
MRTCILLALLAVVCLGQGIPTNLDFEHGEPGKTPPGWFVPDMLRQAGYNAVITREGCHTGACALITGPEKRPPEMFGNLMASIDAAPYRGKRVVLRAAIRVEAVDSTGVGAMWLRVDLPAQGLGFFDNMGDRPIRSTEWAFYEIRGTVAADARTINYGVMAQGNARVRVDDVSLEFGELPADGPDVSAAREEIRKIYAGLDLALHSGDFDFLRTIAAPDARIGSASRKVLLDEAIAQMKSSFGEASRLASKTQITSFDLTGGEAQIRTHSILTFTKNGVTTARESVRSDKWVRTDDGWRLKEAMMIGERNILPAADPETMRAVAAELRKQLVPISTVEPGAPQDDLEAFGKAVGDARVVALGEATHGTHEIFRMKHRLFEYLVQEKGFTVFAIEANWPESQAADRYVKTGEGDPKAALADMYFWTWHTEEVLAMLEWMREFNQAPGKHPILSFTSFDMQTYKVARDRVSAYVRQYAPQALSDVEAAYAPLSKLNARVMTDPAFTVAAEGAERVVSILEARRDALTKASSPEAFRDTLQMARIAAQGVRMRAPGAGFAYRDQMMARNVEWLLEEAYPGEKIVLWAHNGHVSFAEREDVRPMGAWLRQALGSRMYVLGFAIHTGTVRAVTRENGRSIGIAESTIPQAAPGSGTATFSAAGRPIYFLELKNRTGTLGQWLSDPHLFRGCGAVWNRDYPDAHMESTALSKSFDGLIYLENTTATRGLP